MKTRALLTLVLFPAASFLFAVDLYGQGAGSDMTKVRVRYFVNDMDASISFYSRFLGFHVDYNPSPGFAILSLGDFQLLLNTPTGPAGAAQPMSDGRKPEPGGWNRIEILVDDLDAQVAKLRAAGLRFRNDIVKGIGGSQILLEDPSGNPIELFQPSRS